LSLLISIDEYVFDVLLRDLVGHDRSPSAFLVYVHLWSQSKGRANESVQAGLQQIAEYTGLSKSAVQNALRVLVRRKLLTRRRRNQTGKSVKMPEWASNY
jgi:DNA-binding MarR family transcriptional regulator